MRRALAVVLALAACTTEPTAVAPPRDVVVPAVRQPEVTLEVVKPKIVARQPSASVAAKKPPDAAQPHALAAVPAVPVARAPDETTAVVVDDAAFDLLPEAALVPPRARPYRRAMLREGRAVWGMGPPVALFGAQIQAESGWNPAARSAYAAGLSQFIPSTADAMAKKYADLGPQAQPLNPQWAIRALVRYDHDIYFGRFVNAVAPATDCDRWAFTLSGYNGGEGWISRDRSLCSQRAGCDPARWYGNVERYTARSESNARENREYPRRIELRYQPNYRSWGNLVRCGS